MKKSFNKHYLLLKWGSLLILLSPVFVYIYILIESLVNFPFYDDFFWYNKLILQARGKSFLTHLQLVVQQHSDHRLILLKSTALLLSSLGPFDFRWPIFLTNGLFFAFSIHLIIRIYRITRQWIFAAPCLFILYQFLPYTVVFSYGLQTLGVLLFLYFAFYYVWQTNRLAYTVTGLSTLFCFLSNSNGLLLIPIIIVLYSLTHRFRVALIYGVLLVIACSVYFLGNYQWNAGTVRDLPKTNPILHYYRFLAELLGSWFNSSLNFGYPLSIAMGTLMLLFICWALLQLMYQVNWQRWYISPVSESTDEKRNLLFAATCMLGFILLTCLLLTYKRYGGTALQNNIVPHYRQYSMFTLCFAYIVGLLSVGVFARQWPYVIACTFLCIVGNIASYLYIHHDLRLYTLQLKADAYNWRANQAILFFPPIEGEIAWKTITQEMALSYKRSFIAKAPVPKTVRLLPGRIAANISQSDNGLIISLINPIPVTTYVGETFIILRNARSAFYFPFINNLNRVHSNLSYFIFIMFLYQAAIA